MTLPSKVIYNPSNKDWWTPIYQWWQENGNDKSWGIDSSSCAVGHMKINEDSTYTSLPQCTDTFITCEGKEKLEIFEGDTLVWDGNEIIVDRTGIGYNSRSYLDSLRVPSGEV